MSYSNELIAEALKWWNSLTKEQQLKQWDNAYTNFSFTMFSNHVGAITKHYKRITWNAN